jgi:hypothetical protein
LIEARFVLCRMSFSRHPEHLPPDAKRVAANLDSHSAVVIDSLGDLGKLRAFQVVRVLHPCRTKEDSHLDKRVKPLRISTSACSEKPAIPLA